MDYLKKSQDIATLLKSAAPEGGTISDYSKIPTADQDREVIVSHLKSTYTTETGEMLNAKDFADTAKTYKNMMQGTGDELGKTRDKMKELRNKIQEAETEVGKSEKIRNILLILVVSVSSAVALYIMGGEWAHGGALIVLLLGFWYATYSSANPSRSETSYQFSDITQWMSTTLDLWPTSKSSPSPVTSEPTSTK